MCGKKSFPPCRTAQSARIPPRFPSISLPCSCYLYFVATAQKVPLFYFALHKKQHPHSFYADAVQFVRLLTNNDSALRHNQLAADVLLCRQGKSKRNRSYPADEHRKDEHYLREGGANRSGAAGHPDGRKGGHRLKGSVDAGQSICLQRTGCHQGDGGNTHRHNTQKQNGKRTINHVSSDAAFEQIRFLLAADDGDRRHNDDRDGSHLDTTSGRARRCTDEHENNRKDFGRVPHGVQIHRVKAGGTHGNRLHAVIGNVVNVKVVKNKVAPPYKSCRVDMIYGQGISHLHELANLALGYGIIKKSGSWFNYGEERLGQGSTALYKFLTTNTEEAQKIENTIRENMQNGVAYDPKLMK